MELGQTNLKDRLTQLSNDTGDISDRGTRELNTDREFLRQILDINPNLIFAKDRQGRFTLVNKAIAEIYGTTVDQLVGKTDADFNADDEQVAFFRRIDLQVMDSKKEILIPEEVLTDSSGCRHWLQTVKRPIIGQDGIANQVLGVATDITQRRELEEELRQAQKMDAIGKLAGGIAHDFNNMLAVILGNTERLLNKCGSESTSNKALIEGLELIQSAGTRAASLVRQLLTFSRKQPVTPIVLDLNVVVTGISEILRTTLGKRVRLLLETSDNPLHIRIDRSCLEQVIVNLTVNARDAIVDEGTLTVSVAPYRKKRKPKLLNIPSNDCVVLTFCDSGVGIPDNLRDRIFEPFFSTKSERGKSIGLGLSIVHGIIEQVGATINVESEVGRGTTFRMFFPRVQHPVTTVSEPTPSEIGKGDETIVVCEDQPEVLQLVRELLTEYGYHVLGASSGSDAVRMIAGHKGSIHLLLTDVVMPGMTGRQLADAARTYYPNILVLFMTGYPADVLDSLDGSGAPPSVLPKPFQSRELLRVVRDLLDA